MEISLEYLAAILDGRLEGPGDRVVSGLKGMQEAGPQDVAFLANPRYAKFLPQCRAGVVLVRPDQKTPEGLAVIRVADPYLAYAKLLTHATQKPFQAKGVHERAVVEASASVGKEVTVEALAYVGQGASLGERVLIHAGAYVGPGVKIGDDTVIHPHVVIYHDCSVGKRCIIHSGTVIGADGYGFVPEGEGYFKIPQVGVVQIDDDVELGALNTVDRAAMGRTWVQRGVKTDNMVHIAHNCVIGENTLLVAQVGISGSTKLGRHVVLGGQTGVGGHITVGDNVQAGAKSGIAQSVPDGDIVSGFPVMPHRLWLRTRSLIRRLPELYQRVTALEARITDNTRSGPQE